MSEDTIVRQESTSESVTEVVMDDDQKAKMLRATRQGEDVRPSGIKRRNTFVKGFRPSRKNVMRRNSKRYDLGHIVFITLVFAYPSASLLGEKYG